MNPWHLGSRTLSCGFQSVDAAEFPHTLRSRWGVGGGGWGVPGLGPL